MNTLFGLSPSGIWAIVGLLLILAEFIAPGLIVFFFGLSAITLALLLLIIPINFGFQILLFSALAVLYLVGLRKQFSKIFRGFSGGDLDAALIDDDTIGATAQVVEAIDEDRPGTVEFRGVRWQAEADQTIAEGTRVRIVSRQSILLKVEPTKPN